jgi:hypothetical protein
MIDAALRVVVFFAGLGALTLILLSVSRAALVNRLQGDWLAHRIGRLVCAAVTRIASVRRDYDAIQDALAWVLPLYALLLILSWFLLVLAGFTLIIWSWQVEPSLLKAAIASGSALSTLGFLTPTGVSGQWLAIVEGAIGLGVVVFFFTFIPGYQTSIQARELKVAWVYARAGVEPSGFALIEWLHESGVALSTSELWEDWEVWFRELIESLTLAPILTYVPTLQRGQTWLAAAATILDATSFSLATMERKGTAPAKLCYDTGVHTLRMLAAQESRRASFTPTGNSWDAARSEFDATCSRMAMVGAPIRADLDESWRRFVALRNPYEGPLSQLAARLLIPMRNSLPLPR